jgi:drug/metabolite transporter (DMT)-like permease
MVNVVLIPALTVAVLTALQISIQKHVVTKMSNHMVFVIGALVYAILSLFYISWHGSHLQTQIENLSVPIVLILVAGSILGFLANMIYTSIIHHGDIAVVSALSSTAPIFVAGLAFLVLGETLNMKQLAGIGAIVGGTILLT